MDKTSETSSVASITIYSPEHLRLIEEKRVLKEQMRIIKARLFQLNKASVTQYKLDKIKAKLSLMD